ncbi:IS30 family transposase [Pseudazoarcus pumilus]|uniref:IS30 family transposase n=1 Tax=Pseudazoarcus pumilus TaxID=2067960 RepID=A0A2I6S8X4_9RHOO|nr:IS30 family transposase [Pseudazoarcus pumilus]AUN94476.1 IS30 family transposase [Pseudazoarcus pumilus]AUN94478.1 IS30 family transposase [Pseudazoarcus pumilus]AUN95715.1 IS30 family transposase [Pseudazoarcus pumilus]
MQRNYTHLSAEERGLIMAERLRGSSGAHIARILGRCRSTISRELSRNRVPDGDYRATIAGAAYRRRRQACVRPLKLVEGAALYAFVRHKLLDRYWSPQQIAARLRQMHPDDPTRQVSHETIYATIYAHPKGALRQDMIAALRQSKPARGRPRRSAARPGGLPIAEALRIHNRPEEIESRQLPGHWEGDFIKGAFNRSAVGTLVERKSRFVVLCKMDGCSAEAALEGFTRQMKKVPAFLRESLTYDRGSEMARHEELARRLKLDIWFADPYSPWQRGSNENTNGLLRQFLPKGADLSQVSQIQLNAIARLMNGRPRQTLEWKTPEEVMAQDIAQFRNRVALDS